MEGNSAKKVPTLDRLVDTASASTSAQPQKPAVPLAQNQPNSQQKPVVPQAQGAQLQKPVVPKTQNQGAQQQPVAPNTQNQTTKPILTNTNGNTPIKKENSTTVESLDTPQNRRTDKSQFEIELTQIVNRIMSQYIGQASEQIVQQVLREVRARLPGQRKQ